jgi:hypothetical protein
MELLRLLSLIFCLFSVLTVSAQTTKTVQVISENATVSATTDVVVNTGVNTALTLPSSPAAGRLIQVINHGTGDILLSSMVWVSKTDSFDFIPSYPNEIRPKISTNKISIIWDSVNSRWRLLSW